MNHIHIRPVQSAKERHILLTFPWQIYRHDSLWVPPLLPERAKVIDPNRSPFFRRGYADFFIAWRNGKPVGTICAANDQVTNQQRNRRDCMFGFFECIEDYSVAKALFDHAATWARQHDLESLYGPFNLDYEDGYGILIEGRDRPPALLCGHTPPYYQEFVERYGFKPARGDNLAFAIPAEGNEQALQRLSRLADRVRDRGRIQVRSADINHWQEEAERVYILLNKALAHLTDFIPWQREAVLAMLDQFRPIADPELVLFAEADGETVGWFAAIPNLNEILIHVNGLRYPWDYLKLWWYSRQPPKSLAIKSVLVLPEYWDIGVGVLLFDEMAKRALAKGFRWADLSLTSEDNPDTPILAERMGAKIYKRYRVYRLYL
jgi:GNAT superfamily N-acetyltransferase